jgi:hypothetical protein
MNIIGIEKIPHTLNEKGPSSRGARVPSLIVIHVYADKYVN